MVLLGILSAAGLFYWQVYASKQSFLPGVVIAATDVQGYNVNQASTVLQQSLNLAYLNPVVFTHGDYRRETTLGALAFPVDVPKVVNEVLKEEQQRGWMSRAASIMGQKPVEYQVPIEYRADVVQNLLKEWQESLGIPSVDARLEMDKVRGLIVVPEKIGKEIDYNATWAQMSPDWGAASALEVNIVMQNTHPAVTEKDLAGMGELSSYTTWYKVAEVDRTHNLTKAANIINGVMIKPGQIFSFNQTVGPRTGVTGYRDALIIVGDKFEPGTGGGICQVSSTLYNANLLAGLEIVERYNHGLLVAYIPPGLDATVAYGLQDYRFKNNTDSPVYIRATAGGGKLTISIYGNLAYKKRVKLSYVIDEVIPFQEVRELRPDLAPGETRVDHNGVPGYVVRSFRSYLDANGKVISSEQLGRDRYRPLNKLILMGDEPSAGPAENEPEDPNDKPGEPADSTTQDATDEPGEPNGPKLPAGSEDPSDQEEVDA
jgi:vancomycin resistance protein YoaR